MSIPLPHGSDAEMGWVQDATTEGPDGEQWPRMVPVTRCEDCGAPRPEGHICEPNRTIADLRWQLAIARAPRERVPSPSVRALERERDEAREALAPFIAVFEGYTDAQVPYFVGKDFVRVNPTAEQVIAAREALRAAGSEEENR